MYGIAWVWISMIQSVSENSCVMCCAWCTQCTQCTQVRDNFRRCIGGGSWSDNLWHRNLLVGTWRSVWTNQDHLVQGTESFYSAPYFPDSLIFFVSFCILFGAFCRNMSKLLSSEKSFWFEFKKKVEICRDVLHGFHGLPWSPTVSHGLPRSPCLRSCEVSDPQVGLISPPHSLDWNPMSISWDGSSQLYFTDANEGAIYTVPSLLAMQQEMVKFADAPYCHGIAILLGTGSSWNTNSVRTKRKDGKAREGHWPLALAFRVEVKAWG